MKKGTNQYPARRICPVAHSRPWLPSIWSPARIRANSCNSYQKPSFPSVNNSVICVYLRPSAVKRSFSWFPPLPSVNKPGFNRPPTAASLISFGQIRITPTKSDPQKNDFFNPAGSPTARSRPRPRSRPSSPATGPSPSRNPFSFNRSRARSCQIVPNRRGGQLERRAPARPVLADGAQA